MQTPATIYTYKNCDTCRKALHWLRARNLPFTEIPIRDQPPSRPELRRMLAVYKNDLRKLFNTSGQDYKAGNLKEKLPGMSVDHALDLLSTNGNLVKRPFILAGSSGAVGFKEEEWKRLFAV